MFRLALLFLETLLVVPAIAADQTRTVALTFDDLPLAVAGSEGLQGHERVAEAQRVNRAILAALKRHHAPAIAFVNEKKVIADGATGQNREILRQWIRSGYDLGNHTFSHPDLSTMSAADFEQEVLTGEASVKPLMSQAGRELHFFRFPYNHTGETVEKHAEVEHFLRQHGYELATCTMENSDWTFARAYSAMLSRKDMHSAQRLRDDYLTFTEKQIEYFSALDQRLFGHQIPEVMLLHANQLNADMLNKILNIFERMHFRFVTLAEAQSDPAFRTPDTFVTADGWMWGYRWAKELKVAVDGRLEPEVPAWIEEYLKRLQQTSGSK